MEEKDYKPDVKLLNKPIEELLKEIEEDANKLAQEMQEKEVQE